MAVIEDTGLWKSEGYLGGWGLPMAGFFFTREHLKSAREQFEKSAREHFETAREDFGTNLPVNP